MRFLLATVFLVPLLAQEPASEPAKPRRPMPEPKNLKVLKIPNSELIPTMRAYTAALGVKCDYCHIQGNFASDDNPHKDVARHMITMLGQINTNFTNSDVKVSCYTCHRGEAEPKMAPAAAAPGERGGAPPAPPKE